MTKLLLGINDLESFCKNNNKQELLAEWDYEKNDSIPSQVLSGSGKVVWWKCKNKHSYKKRIADRSGKKNGGCPYCSGRFVKKGENDLATLYPDIAKEWNIKKNGVLPSSVKPHSNIKVWWKCEKGHEYQASPNSRCRGTRCPYCVNHKILEGYNDFATTNKELLREWNYERNVIKPTEISKGYDKKVWWICNKLHEWESTISNRRNAGCPICSKENRTSFPEQAIFYYIKKYFSNAINGDRVQINPWELDVYIPDLRVGIEYDGQAWHTNNKKDIKKNMACKQKGILLYRIRENNCNVLQDGYARCYSYDGKDYDKLSEIITCILKDLGIEECTIDINKDRNIIYNNYVTQIKEKSLAQQNPQLCKEWNFDKNYPLMPDQFSYASEKLVWWKCEKGHEWQAIIGNRVKGRGCPVCSNRKIQEGINDLNTTNPEILAEWDYTKNTIKPSEVMYGSSKKIWWRCSLNHSYETSLNNKSKGKGCPYCSNKRVMIGYNDVQTTNPEILFQWNYEKNNITPCQITKGYDKKVWWKCELGHDYQAFIYNKVKGGGCPYCNGKKVWIGYNDLESTFPEVLKFWDYDKNIIIGVEPTNITRGSNKKVFWRCKECSAEWKTSPNSITKWKKMMCPICLK